MPDSGSLIFLGRRTSIEEDAERRPLNHELCMPSPMRSPTASSAPKLVSMACEAAKLLGNLEAACQQGYKQQADDRVHMKHLEMGAGAHFRSG